MREKIMTPLKSFKKLAQALNMKPFRFWDEPARQTIISCIKDISSKLKKSLERKKLQETMAYKSIMNVCESVESEFDEVKFIRELRNLIAVYRKSSQLNKLGGILDEVDEMAQKAEDEVLNYHLAIDRLKKKAKDMSEYELKEKDLKTLQDVGVFYVLEYTLQVLYEFSRLNDVDKKKLLKEGLRVKAGNLPAYLPLEDTFRKELAYKIFDEKLRDRILQAFYSLEKMLYNNSVEKIGKALKAFNLELLQAFAEKGLEQFKAAIYKPFGANVPIKQVIQNVKSLTV